MHEYDDDDDDDENADGSSLYCLMIGEHHDILLRSEQVMMSIDEGVSQANAAPLSLMEEKASGKIVLSIFIHACCLSYIFIYTKRIPSNLKQIM